MIAVQSCPPNHFALDTESAAAAKFREMYGREPGEQDVKCLDRGRFGKLYFVEIPKGR